MASNVCIGIDTGGTFTDVAVVERGRVRAHKVPSTPADPAAAVLAGLDAAAGGERGDSGRDVVHGSTVGLNAVLTGRVARTAFVTNAGFEDLIEIGRQTRTSLYDLRAPKPAALVPRRLRFGVAARRTAEGRLLARPAAGELRALRDKLRRAGVEAVAVGLLHGYAHPEDERRIAAALAGLGVPVTCSAALLPAPGEYERFSSAIINAAIAPIMGAYVQRLETGVAPGRLRLMRSSGGIMPATEAAEFPARAVFSGPAGGVLAVRQLAAALELDAVAALDMGGTSTDVSLVTPRARAHAASTLAGLPLGVPAVEVHTIGCGGGSIALADAGGALRVGPQSAGADPGPACYGVGAAPTVTDAHMVLGHMGAATLLAGDFPVDPALSVAAVERLGRALGLGLRETARGILEIAEVAMVRALMVITVERAVDPASVPLVAFGGAGGLHAASLARRLSMPCAVVPVEPGAVSAIGLALAGASHETARPLLADVRSLPAQELRGMARDLGAAAAAALREQGVAGRVSSRVEARMRFAGQGAALGVPFGWPLEPRFRAAHAELYGFAPEDAAVEIVELAARAETPARRWPRGAARRAKGSPQPAERRRPPAGGAAWKVFRREELAPGHQLAGPCLIEERTGAVVVPAGFRCRVDAAALVLEDTGRRR